MVGNFQPKFYPISLNCEDFICVCIDLFRNNLRAAFGKQHPLFAFGKNQTATLVVVDLLLVVCPFAFPTTADDYRVVREEFFILPSAAKFRLYFGEFNKSSVCCRDPMPPVEVK